VPLTSTQISEHLLNWLYSAKHYSSSFVSSLPNGNGVLASSIGKKRSSNQDRVAYAEIAQKNDFFIVYVLADGIGGGKAGDLCASRAITEFLAELSAVNSKESTEKKLSSILKKVNKSIYSDYKGEGGTTFSALVYDKSFTPYICHSGDSRIFLCEKNETIVQLTQDGSAKEKLKELNFYDPNKVNPSIKNSLVQFVGCGEDFSPQVEAIPSTSPTGIYLILSDGIHRVGNNFIEKVTGNSLSYKEVASRLISIAEWEGGIDNASIIATSGPKNFSPASEPPYLLVSQGGKEILVPCLPTPPSPGKAKKTASSPHKKKEPQKEKNEEQLSIDVFYQDDKKDDHSGQ